MRPAYLLFALPLLAVGAEAQEVRGAYFGLSYGNLHYGNNNVVNGVESSGIGSFSKSEDLGRLLGGFRINEHFGVEAGWGKTSLIDYDRTTVYSAPGAPLEYSRSALDVEIETRTLRAVGNVPFERLNLFGSVGYYNADLEGEYLNAGASYYEGGYYYGGWYYYEEPYYIEPYYYEWVDGPHSIAQLPSEFDRRSLKGVTLAGGVQFDFRRGPSLRVEYEYYFTPQDVSLHTVSFGALYRLGRNRSVRD
jgi:opacity protein-like surface antigen